MDGITCQFTGPNANSKAVITKEQIGDLFGNTPRFTQILFNNNIVTNSLRSNKQLCSHKLNAP